MKCAAHTDLDAAGYCRNCGKPMCGQCTRDVRGVLYCEPCLAAMVGHPQARPPGQNSPALAALLGFIPGLGAVYNGEYLKALIHVIIFGGLIALMSSDQSGASLAIVIVLFIAFCFYMPVEAHRVASARLAGRPAPGILDLGASPPEPPGKSSTSAGFAPDASPAPGEPGAMQTGLPRSRHAWLVGPAILILLGVGFLLANFGVLEMDWLGQYWPVFLIIIGAGMAWRRLQR